MGQVPGELVRAAFGCFNPQVVVPAVRRAGRSPAATTILAARERAATASLRRILGDQPEGLARVTVVLRRGADAAPWVGRASFQAFVRSASGNPIGGLWRAADLVREHRGDGRVLSWAVGGADAVEVLLLDRAVMGAPARFLCAEPGWRGADMDEGPTLLARAA